MSLEWIITGMILFGGMAAAGISLCIKRRKTQIFDPFEANEAKSDLAESKNDKKYF